MPKPPTFSLPSQDEMQQLRELDKLIYPKAPTPPPAPRAQKYVRGSNLPFRTLEVGEGFALPAAEAKSVNYLLTAWNGRLKPKHFRSQTLPNNTIRIWRDK